MKNIIFIILFILFSQSLFSQTKIYIICSGINKAEPYSLSKASDSVYVQFRHSEDMGVRYGFHYEFAKDIKDGHYLVYINDTLSRELFFKNRSIDSTDIRYFRSGKIAAVDNYSNGKKQGESKELYESGELSSFAEYENGFTYLITEYYKSGNVKRRSFFLPDDSQCRTEFFDENGRLSETFDGNINNRDNPILEMRNNFNDGILDGEQSYVYKKYFYRIEYKMNKIIKFILRDNQGNIIQTKVFQ